MVRGEPHYHELSPEAKQAMVKQYQEQGGIKNLSWATQFTDKSTDTNRKKTKGEAGYCTGPEIFKLNRALASSFALRFCITGCTHAWRPLRRRWRSGSLTDREPFCTKDLMLRIFSHIISYYIISYHITSYHITYHIISYIMSYRIISYHFISYHII